VVVVIGLALILLMLVFRSILVRIKAAVGFPAQHRRLDGTRGRDLPGRPHGKARESIVTGYRQSGRVVSAAAGLAFAPRSPDRHVAKRRFVPILAPVGTNERANLRLAERAFLAARSVHAVLVSYGFVGHRFVED
jgi:hypothetical protein